MRRFQKRQPPPQGQVSALHLKAWLHNELAGTDNSKAEGAYYAVLNHLAIMQGAEHTHCAFCGTEVVLRDDDPHPCCPNCSLAVSRP